MRHSLWCGLSLGVLACILGCAGAQTSAPTSPESEPESSAGPASVESPAESSTETDADSSSPGIKVGAALHGKRSVKLSFALNLSQKGKSAGVQIGDWSLDEERSLTVKAAQGDKISELVVLYGLWEAKPLLGLSSTVPTQGKTYRIKSSGGQTSVLSESGESVTSEEQRAVEADYAWVGATTPLREALLATDLKPGADLSTNSDIARAILGELPGVDASSTSVQAKLRSVSSGPTPKANLTVDAKLQLRSDKTLFELTVTGPVTVDVNTGWVETAQLSGTAKATGELVHKKRGPLEVEGSGKIEIGRTAKLR